MRAAVTHWGQDRDIHAGPLDDCPETECLTRGEIVRRGWLSHDLPTPPPPLIA